MKPSQMVCPIKNWDELEQVEIDKLMFAPYAAAVEGPDKIHFYNRDTRQKLFTVVVPPWFCRVCKELERNAPFV